MDKDIKKLIAEEAHKHWSASSYKEAAEEAQAKNDMCQTSAMARKVSFASFKEGANFILSKWQEAERWRKVEEEPTNQDLVLVKTDKGCFATAYYHGKNSGWIVYGNEAYKQFGNITEWKPIS